MFRYLISAVVAVAAILPAAALGVNASPGQLSSLIDKPADVSKLTVTGSIDARDLFFIADEMSGLKSLDLSDVSIVAYEGPAVKLNVSYDENQIPAGTFAGCSIESIRFGATPLFIGSAAFTGSALKSVAVPAGYTLDAGVFAACKQLKEATLAMADVPAGCFSGCTALQTVDLGGAAAVGLKAFMDCKALAKVDGTQALTTIGADAFDGCFALQTFAFPATLTSIGEGAFIGSGLISADLAACKRLTAIGDWAFAQSPSLAEVHLPNSVADLGEGSFFDCGSLVSLNLPAACPALANYSLKGAQVDASDLLGAGVTEIGNYALAGNTATTTIVLPESLEKIGDHAMAGMTSLKVIGAEKLQSVPELGSDVWAGLDQPAVELKVLGLLYDDFATADQWKNFTIVKTASADNMELSAQQQVRGRFEGYDLKVDFGGKDAREVAVYDVSGVCLATVQPVGESVSIDTSAWQNRVYLVRVLLADGNVVSLKLAR